jgi:hypothetical protein
MIEAQTQVQLSQILAPGPTMSLRTFAWVFPQKLQFDLCLPLDRRIA